MIALVDGEKAFYEIQHLDFKNNSQQNRDIRELSETHRKHLCKTTANIILMVKI